MNAQNSLRAYFIFSVSISVVITQFNSVAHSEETKPTDKKSFTKLKVGQEILEFSAYGADGNVNTASDKHVQGKITLLTYWSLKDKNFNNQIQKIEHLRDKFADHPDFMIVSIYTDYWEDYIQDMNKRGRSFYSNSRMWMLCYTHASEETIRNYNGFGREEVGEGKTPRNFLYGPNKKIIALDIPLEDLESTVKEALTKHNKSK